MNIQWFPGHMTKSLRDMEVAIKGVDFIIYVLDSRAPFACINPKFDTIFAKLPIIYVLNKADIAPSSVINNFIKKMTSSNREVVAIDSTKSSSAKNIVAIARRLCKYKIDKYSLKGIKVSLGGMVVGVPNVGKSTLINNLVGKKKTLTGNRPGVTRAIQSVKVDEYLEIKDTPGTLYPKLDNQEVAVNLAIIGSIRDEVLDSVELAKELIHKLFLQDIGCLTSRYGIDTDDTFDIAVDKIALKRGYLLKGGLLDVEKSCIALIDDFRKGYLGKISLE